MRWLEESLPRHGGVETTASDREGGLEGLEGYSSILAAWRWSGVFLAFWGGAPLGLLDNWKGSTPTGTGMFGMMAERRNEKDGDCDGLITRRKTRDYAFVVDNADAVSQRVRLWIDGPQRWKNGPEAVEIGIESAAADGVGEFESGPTLVADVQVLEEGAAGDEESCNGGRGEARPFQAKAFERAVVMKQDEDSAGERFLPAKIELVDAREAVQKVDDIVVRCGVSHVESDLAQGRGTVRSKAAPAPRGSCMCLARERQGPPVPSRPTPGSGARLLDEPKHTPIELMDEVAVEPEDDQIPNTLPDCRPCGFVIIDRVLYSRGVKISYVQLVQINATSRPRTPKMVATSLRFVNLPESEIVKVAAIFKTRRFANIGTARCSMGTTGIG
ncbi:hypothetical protein BDK51DRAFT_49862 [Blyttiomyces helicus]|uniref:Uncharacterized protein n=1 Tax=Blyttiomyces helicus TaxID=388810 RepID=A0A4P9W169_9FUNG|nr:hypothetical protein BDK51DRAFT_49862 [Blyttiomyces helicus]|eukprot:RKO84448.1 hypothetical protein BDK51DRAFT_49862 [Blyttiomyces helicus]